VKVSPVLVGLLVVFKEHPLPDAQTSRTIITSGEEEVVREMLQVLVEALSHTPLPSRAKREPEIGIVDVVVLLLVDVVVVLLVDVVVVLLVDVVPVPHSWVP
jgi:hypothetical protein